MKTLSKLQAECEALGLQVKSEGRSSKEPYLAALREYFWQKEHPGEPLPDQVMPMLLGDWNDLAPDQAEEIEQDHHAWIAQPKLDGVRALLHIENGKVRLSSRVVSEVTYRLSEFQDNVSHLSEGLSSLSGTILDGELVCPVRRVNTGSCRTDHPLQAAMAILATSPENAQQIQDGQNAHLRFHVFDILKFAGTDVTDLPLYERQAVLFKAIDQASNRFLEIVPSVVVGKQDFHERVLASNGEGTVWKRADEGYQVGRRVRHWLKRKRGTEVEAFVSGFKCGRPEAGHAHLVGAVEFSVSRADGATQPIAWVSSWTDAARAAMTHHDPTGKVSLNPLFIGRKAVILGHDQSARSKRIRHARIQRWLDDLQLEINPLQAAI